MQKIGIPRRLELFLEQNARPTLKVSLLLRLAAKPRLMALLERRVHEIERKCLRETIFVWSYLLRNERRAEALRVHRLPSLLIRERG